MTDRGLLISAARVVTCDEGRCDDDNPTGAVDDASVLVDGGAIRDVGPTRQLAAAHPDARRLDYFDAVLTPGLVDAHTHAAWVGSRGREYAMRMAGADYEAIGKAGGGIVASMRATRAAGVDEIESALRARLGRMAALGVTTVEVKSGYGLEQAAERRQLAAAANAAKDPSLPAVVPTFLGLHALPPEASGDRDAYARDCGSWLEGIARDGLARFVDAYVDRNAFSVDQARPVLARGRELGLGVRLHIGQFADVGGAALAADLGAASADHLEHIDDVGARALAAAGTRAVLLPVASFTLAQSPPPVERLRQAGVKLVIASDANPGSAPTESLPLALSLAVRSYGLSVAEALIGATREAALSLGSEAGVLRAGAPADLVVWDLPHEAEIIQPWGTSRVLLVMREGRQLVAAS